VVGASVPRAGSARVFYDFVGALSEDRRLDAHATAWREWRAIAP